MACFDWGELKAVINSLLQGGILKENMLKSDYEAGGEEF